MVAAVFAGCVGDNLGWPGAIFLAFLVLCMTVAAIVYMIVDR